MAHPSRDDREVGTLRDLVRDNPELAEPAVAIAQQFASLDDAKWLKFVKALEADNRKDVAKLLGTTVEQLEKDFRGTKQKAKSLVRAHPELLNRMKSF